MSNAAIYVPVARVQNASDECKTLYEKWVEANRAVYDAEKAMMAAFKKTPMGVAMQSFNTYSDMSLDTNKQGITIFAKTKLPLSVTQAYIGESTMNLLLNSKLLSEAEKKALLTKQFPTIFPAQPEAT